MIICDVQVTIPSNNKYLIGCMHRVIQFDLDPAIGHKIPVAKISEDTFLMLVIKDIIHPFGGSGRVTVSCVLTNLFEHLSDENVISVIDILKNAGWVDRKPI